MFITCCFWQPTCVLQIIKKNKTLNDVHILSGPRQFRLAMRRQKRTKCDIFKNIVLKKLRTYTRIRSRIRIHAHYVTKLINNNVL